MEKYVRGKLLGKGSFGTAFLATSKVDGKNYVIKEIDISRMPKSERDAAEQEAKLLMALRHPNIVSCSECFTWGNKLCIVMDWCAEGDLYTIMERRKGQPLPESTLLDWFVQMCLGLKHVHDRKILHRDIKSQNVFMSSGGLLKLGDFGVSKILASTWQLAATAVGTPYYLSPEICLNKKYNQKSDIWSLGCVLYELATGRHAFEAPNMRALLQKIIKGTYPPVPTTRSLDLADLINRMLTIDTNRRPSINEVLATTLIKQRIASFLSTTLQAHEFCHTVIHGRPAAGQLLVGMGPHLGDKHVCQQEAKKPDDNDMGAKQQGPQVTPSSSPSPPVKLSAPPPPRNYPQLQVPVRLSGPAALHYKSPQLQAGRGGPGQPGPARPQAGAAPGPKACGGQAALPSPSPPTAVPSSAPVDPQHARLVAAVAAQREMERMRLQEQEQQLERQKQEMDAARKLVLQKKEVAARAEAQAAARAKIEEDRLMAERKRIQAAKEKEAAEKARKEKERLRREQEREQLKKKIQEQRAEFMARQQAAQMNKRRVAEEEGRAARPCWVEPEVPDVPEALGCPVPPKGGEVLTPEQRRQVYEEMRAQALCNKRQAQEEERAQGLAAFLGVPGKEEPPHVGLPRARSDAPLDSPHPEDKIHNAFVHGANKSPRDSPQTGIQCQVGTSSPWIDRRRQKLEEERQLREEEVRQFQRQHWEEIRAAAKRNRDHVKQEGCLAAGQEGSPLKEASTGETSGNNRTECQPQEESDFAAMMKQMQEVLEDPIGGRGLDQDDEPNEEANSNEEEDVGALRENVLKGHFHIGGREVSLPVQESDSLAYKVEALRIFLEDELGTASFLRAYHAFEGLVVEGGQEGAQLGELLPLDQMHLGQLIHQLIVCEELIFIQGPGP